MAEKHAIDRLVDQLKQEGWKEQRDGIIGFNSSYGTNLFKDGEVLTINVDTQPDEEVLEELWPEDDKAGEAQ